MNILCIGNSFSEDVTRYLHQISDEELYVRNLYIGGCSLERHYNNIIEEKADYEYQKNGRMLRMISANEALTKKKWDFITVQQVSQLSGIAESYEPYLSAIIEFIKEKCPSAEILLHRTWAYDDKSDHPGFVNYGCSRKVMYEAIVNASNEIAKKHGLRVIPTGDAIELAREIPEFSGAERNINRDGFHLSLDYGRYLGGLVLFGFLTGKDPRGVTYEPENTSKEINYKLKEIALVALQQNAQKI